MKTTSQTIKKFTDILASSSPTPGGGAAAALTGALGTSLAEMVTRINQKRRPDASAEKRISSFEAARKALLYLIDEDAAAFKKLAAFDKDKRQGAAYEKALKAAASAPLKICELVSVVLKVSTLEKNRTSTWLMSDLVEAGLLLKAAFSSARLNVEINLKCMQDKNFCRLTQDKLDKLENELKRNQIHA